MATPPNPPKVALFGRPNVGKSTLFNRLIRSNRAITHDRPGITRDRMEGIVRGRGKEPFLLIDTGGVTLDSHARVQEGPEGIRGFEQDILDQARDALAESALVCLVVDARDGLTPLDSHLADYLRKSGKPLLMVVNKVDGPERQDFFLAEFHGLGLEMLPVSAAHGYNVRALEDEIRKRLFDDVIDEEPCKGAARDHESATGALLLSPPCGEAWGGSAPPKDEAGSDPTTTDYTGPDLYSGPLRLALLGRPNAGKSSLVNAMIGEKRMIVSDVAGTTRDSVDVTTQISGESVTFVDTAGVRRRAKITDIVERYSVNSSIKSTTKAHVTLLVLDAVEGLPQQDKRLIDLLNERKTPFLLLINKSDLIEPKKRKEVEKIYKEALVFCPHVPILFVSAVSGYNLKKIVPLARSIRKECGMRVSTGRLNRAMSTVLDRHQPPIVKKARAKFFYLTQAESLPPTFVFFVNDADRVLPSYARYLERSLRKMFGIAHAPMRVNFRSSHIKKGDKKGRKG